MRYRIQNGYYVQTCQGTCPLPPCPHANPDAGSRLNGNKHSGWRPQSTRQTQDLGEKPPKPNTILPNCRHATFCGPAAALPLRRRSLSLARSAKSNNSPARRKKSNYFARRPITCTKKNWCRARPRTNRGEWPITSRCPYMEIGRRVRSTSPLPRCGTAGGDGLRRLLGDRLSCSTIIILALVL